MLVGTVVAFFINPGFLTSLIISEVEPTVDPVQPVSPANPANPTHPFNPTNPADPFAPGPLARIAYANAKSRSNDIPGAYIVEFEDIQVGHPCKTPSSRENRLG